MNLAQTLVLGTVLIFEPLSSCNYYILFSLGNLFFSVIVLDTIFHHELISLICLKCLSSYNAFPLRFPRAEIFALTTALLPQYS